MDQIEDVKLVREKEKDWSEFTIAFQFKGLGDFVVFRHLKKTDAVIKVNSILSEFIPFTVYLSILVFGNEKVLGNASKRKAHSLYSKGNKEI